MQMRALPWWNKNRIFISFLWWLLQTWGAINVLDVKQPRFLSTRRTTYATTHLRACAAHKVWNIGPQFNCEMGWLLEKGRVQMLHSAVADLGEVGGEVSIGSLLLVRVTLVLSGLVPWMMSSPFDIPIFEPSAAFMFLAWRNNFNLWSLNLGGVS